MIESSDVHEQPGTASDAWESLGPIAGGGTVFALAISPVEEVDRCWAATGCGIFYSNDHGRTWRQTLHGLSSPLVSALAVASNGALFAGSLEGELFASFNYGKTWEGGFVPQELKATVSAVLPSPSFRRDGSAFAATDGAGLLATRSSGKRWEDSSFGLADAHVLAVAAPKEWTGREVLFCATTDGVYMSVNGGRAWRETELMLDGDDVVDALAVSPAFEQDRTVLAGTEAGALYRSTDGGRTWDLLVREVGEGPLNCLWIAPDYAQSRVLLAGVGPRIYRSEDGGESWSEIVRLPNSLLCLAGNDSYLLAGMHDSGVWRSDDGGLTWEPSSEGLYARGFARLVPAGETLYAFGPQEGIWRSDDGGATWEVDESLFVHLPLTAMTADERGTILVASQASGLLRKTPNENWQVTCEGEGFQAVLLTPDGQAWAGTGQGALWASVDGGASWAERESPFPGQEVLAIVASPAYARDRTLLIGTSIPATASKDARVAVWRSTDAGQTWRQVTTQVTSARWLDIAMPIDGVEEPAAHAVLATGPYCLRPLRRAQDVWISSRVDPKGANALALAVLGDIEQGGTLYAATGTGIYYSQDGGRSWQPSLDGESARSFVSIVDARHGGRPALYALSLGGALWRHVPAQA